eukprot:7124255-Prymnesium_polylepis.1
MTPQRMTPQEMTAQQLTLKYTARRDGVLAQHLGRPKAHRPLRLHRRAHSPLPPQQKTSCSSQLQKA